MRKIGAKGVKLLNKRSAKLAVFVVSDPWRANIVRK